MPTCQSPFPCFQPKYFAVVFLVIATVSGGMGADAEPERTAAFEASILQKGTVDEVIQKRSAGKGLQRCKSLQSVLQMISSSALRLLSGTI